MNCSLCNEKLEVKKNIDLFTAYSENISMIEMKYLYCNKCKNKYLTDKQWNFYNESYYDFISNQLKEKYDKNDLWIKKENIDLDESLIPFHLFFKNENKQVYVLKESYEKYKRCKNGFFYIGNKKMRTYDDFYDSLCIKKNKNKFYLNDKTFNFDGSKIKFYGYGGIVFNDNTFITNYELINGKEI